MRTPPVVLMQPSSRCCSGTTLYIYVRFGEVCGLSEPTSSTDEVPDHFDRDAVSGHSALKRCGSSVHGACQNLGPGPQAGLRRSLLRDGSDHVDRLADRREQLCRYAVGLQQLAAPAAVQDVIALRNTRVRGIEREASGEPEVQIAVCLQDPSCFFIKRGAGSA